MTVSVKKKFDNIDDGIANMIAAAIYDYNNWSRSEASEEMKKEFADGFVVNTDDDKLFKKGDLLKCAGWAKPARNKPRGNVLEGGFPINWTGPVYL